MGRRTAAAGSAGRRGSAAAAARRSAADRAPSVEGGDSETGARGRRTNLQKIENNFLLFFPFYGNANGGGKAA